MTETGYLPNLYMAGIILLFSVTDVIFSLDLYLYARGVDEEDMLPTPEFLHLRNITAYLTSYCDDWSYLCRVCLVFTSPTGNEVFTSHICKNKLHIV